MKDSSLWKMAVLQGDAFSMIGVKYDYRGPDEYKMPAFDYWLAEKTFFFLAATKEVFIFVA